MNKVGIAILKNNLSRYIEKVSGGSHFLVMAHNKPVAQLIPVDNSLPQTLEDKLDALEKANIIRLPQNKPEKFSKMKPIHCAKELSAMIIEDRS